MPATVDRRGFLKAAALSLAALAAGMKGAFAGLRESAMGALSGQGAAQAGAGPRPEARAPLHSVSRRKASA
jgi:hypothetical protein